MFALLCANLLALRREPAISRADLNDNAAERGESPLDCRVPEWPLGYPVLRTFRPAHRLVALLHSAVGKSVPLPDLRGGAKFLGSDAEVARPPDANRLCGQADAI